MSALDQALTFTRTRWCDGRSSLVSICSVSLVIASIAASVLFTPSLIFISLPWRNVSILSTITPILGASCLAFFITKRQSLRFQVFDYIVISLMFFLLLRNFGEGESATTIKYVLLGLGIFFLAAITAGRTRLLWILLLSIVVTVCITAVYGFLEYGAQYNFLFRSVANFQPPNSTHRIGSTLSDPVIYGAFLIQTLPFLFLTLRRDSRKLLHLSASITAILWAGLALFLTFSRGSWLAAGLLSAGALIFFLFRGETKRIIIPAIVAIAVLVFITSLFGRQMLTDFSARSGTSSVDVRSIMWKGAVHGIEDNFLIGVGMRKGNTVVQNYVDQAWRAKMNLFFPIDNAYLDFFLEEGIIGFLLLVAVSGAIASAGVRAARVPASRPWALAALASIIGFAINSLTFDSFLIWPNFIFFWIAAGIVRGISSCTDDERKLEPAAEI